MGEMLLTIGPCHGFETSVDRQPSHGFTLPWGALMIHPGEFGELALLA